MVPSHPLSKYELVREEHARRTRYVSRERQIKEAKGDREAAEAELDLGRPVEGKGPVGRRMVGEWRCMDQGVMLHDLKDLDNLAQRYRVLLAASQVVQRVVDECNELRARATTPDDHSAWQLLVMRVGVAQEKLADLDEQFYELHGTEEERREHREGVGGGLVDPRAWRCTGDAREMHGGCTGDAREMHVRCTGDARGMHGRCTSTQLSACSEWSMCMAQGSCGYTARCFATATLLRLRL